METTYAASAIWPNSIVTHDSIEKTVKRMIDCIPDAFRMIILADDEILEKFVVTK